MSITEELDPHHKALTLNLDSSIFGSFAEIGAGQEVARWFLVVGAASGTVAKTISAYDKDSCQRASFLAENCREESLRQQVAKLLINYEEAGSLLDDPVLNPRIPAPNGLAESQADEASRLHPKSGELLATDTGAETEDPMVGRHLGAYKLVRRVGQGGMAAVFLAVRADDEYRRR